MRATYHAEQMSELLGICTWSVYEAARNGTLPEGLEPLKIGRRLVWPKARVDAVLGLDDQPIGMTSTTRFESETSKASVVSGAEAEDS